MPYKDRQKNREAWSRWYKNHPDVRLRRNKIGNLAKYHNPVRQICAIVGCAQLGERHHPDYSKPKEIVWRCKKHHEEEHHKVKRLCSVKDCGRKHWAKSFCLRHLKLSNPKKYMHPERYK